MPSASQGGLAWLMVQAIEEGAERPFYRQARRVSEAAEPDEGVVKGILARAHLVICGPKPCVFVQQVVVRYWRAETPEAPMPACVGRRVRKVFARKLDMDELIEKFQADSEGLPFRRRAVRRKGTSNRRPPWYERSTPEARKRHQIVLAARAVKAAERAATKKKEKKRKEKRRSCSRPTARRP